MDDAVVKFLQSRDGQSDYWPTDDDLSNATVNCQYWKRINQRRLKMVFSAIEHKLRDTGYSETLELTSSSA